MAAFPRRTAQKTVLPSAWPSAAAESAFADVEAFGNRVRRHSTPGSVTPAEYEQAHNLTRR